MLGFPGGSVVKNPLANAGDSGDLGWIPGWEDSLGEGNGNTLVFLSGEFHGQRSLVDHTPWGHYSPWGSRD